MMKKFFNLFFKGAAMGAADVVPGVSGGTIAFITGIYEELINTIKSVDLEAIKLLFSFKFKAFWEKINGQFLASVFAGIAVSILSLAQLMKYLLSNHPILLWSFFFGLIIASSHLVSKEVKKWNVQSAISLLIGVGIAYSITTFTPASTPDTWYFIILSGAIAICAMILPGISGSFILLLLGKYAFIIDAVSSFNLYVIALFGTGAVFGIISFSHVLSWLLKKFHSITTALLTGFMLGSLNKVWPWKKVVETFIDRHGETKPLIEKNILPDTYHTITGNPALLSQAIILGILGFLLIWGVERYAALQKQKAQ